jgi:hypothetical protein
VLFDVREVARFPPDTVMQMWMSVSHGESGERHLAALLMDHVESLLASSRTLAIIDARAATVVRYVELPPLEMGLELLETFDYQSNMIIGTCYSVAAEDKVYEGLWMVGMDTKEIETRTFMDMTQERVGRMRRLHSTIVDNVLYLFGIDADTDRALVLLLTFVPGVFPTVRELRWLGTECVVSMVYSNVLDLVVIVPTKTADMAQVWSMHHPQPLAYLVLPPGYGDLSREEVWASLAIETPSSKECLKDVLHHEPVRFVSNSFSSIVMWEMSATTHGHVLPSCIYWNLGLFNYSCIAPFAGMVLFSCRTQVCVLDLSGAGDVLNNGCLLLTPSHEYTDKATLEFIHTATDERITEPAELRRTPVSRKCLDVNYTSGISIDDVNYIIDDYRVGHGMNMAGRV